MTVETRAATNGPRRIYTEGERWGTPPYHDRPAGPFDSRPRATVQLPAMSESLSRHERALRRGGTVAVAIGAVILGTVSLLWAGQIVAQAWSSSGRAPRDCRDGIRSLISAVDRASNAAAAETGGERAAVERFRAELQPQWGQRPVLEQACRDDDAARLLLREVDLLRYAQERSVRSDAVDVARRRRRVQALGVELGLLSAAPSTSSDLVKPPPAN